MKRYWPMLLTLAALWGASYLFIKVAVEDIPPAPMMAVRTLLAAAVLLGYLAWRLGWTRAVVDLRAAWRHCAVLGVLNAALPFWLIAWGERLRRGGYVLADAEGGEGIHDVLLPTEGLLEACEAGQADKDREVDAHEQEEPTPPHGKPQPPHLHGHQQRDCEDDRAAEGTAQAYGIVPVRLR